MVQMQDGLDNDVARTVLKVSAEGQSPRQQRSASAAVAPRSDFPIVVVGAGFSGLCMGIKLKRAGFDSFIILEKAHDLGGVWQANTYPGARCDIPSPLYCYSFEPSVRWSRICASQREIQEYMRHCADKFGVSSHIRFGKRVERASFDDATGTWSVYTSDGAAPIRARSLVLGNGILHVPNVPNIPGRETFGGTAFHSASWDHSCEIDGKSLAVIGTAASAVQIVPAVAARVAKLHVFQRKAHWVRPSPDRPITERERSWLARFPWLMRLWRSWLYSTYELRVPALKLWPHLMSIPERKALRYMRAAIPDPVVQRKVTPSYRMGCVRILFSNDYYPALARRNVELVADPIAEITPRGVRTADGEERKVDVIVYATGFRVSDYLTPLQIMGRDGRDLSTTWRNDGETYLGITVSGFPNLYLLRGPNTALGHSSTLLMSEAQVDYAISCIDLLRRTGARSMDVRRESQSAFTGALQAEFRRTVWSSGCSSFQTDNPTGKNTYMWPGSSFDYWLRTRRVRATHYDFR